MVCPATGAAEDLGAYLPPAGAHRDADPVRSPATFVKMKREEEDSGALPKMVPFGSDAYMAWRDALRKAA